MVVRRRRGADRAHHRGEMRRAAVVQVVAVDRGDDHVLQAHLARPPRRRGGLGRVERLRQAGGDIAEGAGAGADSPMIIMVAWRLGPALADVRAGRLLADGDQAVSLHDRRGWRRSRPSPARARAASRACAGAACRARSRFSGCLSAAGRDRVHHRDHDSRMRPVCEGRYVVFPSQLIKPDRSTPRRNVARPEAGCGIRAQVDAKG